MTTMGKQKKELGNMIEQKILEFFGDPDSGLRLDRRFAAELRRRLGKKQKLVVHSTVARKYGLR